MNERVSGLVWEAPRATGSIFSSVRIPGSKSLSARELFLCSIGDVPSEVYGLLYARDTDLMVKGLVALGAKISPWPPKVEQPVQIVPIPGLWENSEGNQSRRQISQDLEHPVQIECGLAGTVMRFLPALAVFLGRSVRFSADDSANARPLLPLLEALSELGATWESELPEKGLFPFVVHPPKGEIPSEVSLDSSASSQFVSALLLSAPLLKKNFTVRSKTRQVPSLPHIQMTLETLSKHGINATGSKNRDGVWEWNIESSPSLGQILSIEPDLSNAGPFLAAIGIAGGSVSIPGWPKRSTQAGDLWRQILPEFGMKVGLTSGVLTVRGGGKLNSVKLDCSDFGELVPTIAAVAAYAEGTSVLEGLHHLRGHETDRLQALQTELGKLKIPSKITPEESLCITGVPRGKLKSLQSEANRKPILLSAYGDHRMATFAALMGMYYPVQIDDIGATSKTLPDFPQMWARFIGGSDD